MLFAFMFLVACFGAISIGYILRELRKQRRGQQVPGQDTSVALDDLARRVSMGRI